MAPVVEQTAFPRGKVVDKPSKEAAKGGKQTDGAKGGPAAKRKREESRAPPAEPEFLFGMPKSKKTKKGGGQTKERKVDDSSKPSKSTLGLGCVTTTSRNPEVLDISGKRLTAGVTLLGMVSRVAPTVVHVALPGTMSGQVLLSEISDPLYTRMLAATDEQAQAQAVAAAQSALRVGQVVRCFVMAVEKEATGKVKRVTLSLRASMVNRGLKLEHLLPGSSIAAAVMSEEDHGFVVGTGLEGVTAFLPRKHAKAEVVVGAPMEVVVLALNEAARTLTCGYDPKVVPKAVTRSSSLTLQGLKPGMRVNAVVDTLLKNGLTLSFLGCFSGAVTFDHLDRVYREAEWRKRFRPGDLVHARVLLVDAKEKAVYLTMRSHLLALRPASGVPAVGTMLEDALVLRVEQRRGVLLGVPAAADDADAVQTAERLTKDLESVKAKKKEAKSEGEDIGKQDEAIEARLKRLADAPFYVPVWISSSRVGHNSKEAMKAVKPGQTVRCRVVGSSLLEGAAQGSMLPSTLEAAFVRVGDVKPGMVVKAQVGAIADWGVTVELGEGIRAHCTNMHLADGATSSTSAVAAAKKGGKRVFKVGQAVTCRVLTVDEQTRKVYVTLKPSMVKDKEEPLSSFTQAAAVAAERKKTAYVGFVTRTQDFGVIVTFYNNVYGLLSAKHLAALGADPVTSYRVGQILKCRISSCNATRVPPRMSLKLAVGDDVDEDETELKPGEWVRGVVQAIQEQEAVIKLDGGAGTALLHKYQLVDHAAHADQHMSRLQKGQRIAKALVLELKRGQPLLTIKPLLMHCGMLGNPLDASNQKQEAIKVPRLHDLDVGQVVTGFVSRVETFGLFVRFFDGQSALLPNGLISDRFVAEASGLFREGDSVRCRIDRIDADKEKVYVTTRRSSMPVTSAAFLETLLAESAAGSNVTPWPFAELKGFKERAGMPDWRRFVIGVTVNATVTSVKDTGVTLLGEDKRTVMFAPAPEHALDCSPHDKLKVRVLDADWVSKHLVVTMQPEVVKEGRSKRRKAAQAGKDHAEGARVQATVLLKRDRYAVVGVGGTLAFLAVADYQCPFLASGNLEVGTKVEVVVRRPWRPELEGAAGKYPHESVMLVTLAQEADVAAAAAAGAGKKDRKNKDKKGKKGAGVDVDEMMVEMNGEGVEHGKQKQGKSKTKRPSRVVDEAEIVAGAVIPAMISSINPDELVLAVDVALSSTGKVHSGRYLCKVFVSHSGLMAPADLLKTVQEEDDDDETDGDGKALKLPDRHPLSGYSVGDDVQARVLSSKQQATTTRRFVDCTMRPRDMKAKDVAALQQLQPSWDTLKVGSVHAGVVTEVQDDGLRVALSRGVKGYVTCEDVAEDPSAVFEDKHKAVGAAIVCIVKSVDAVKHRLRLSLKDVPKDVDVKKIPFVHKAYAAQLQAEAASRSQHEEFGVGAVVNATVRLDSRAPKLQPPSVTLQMEPQRFGRVCITELQDIDAWVDKPIEQNGGETSVIGLSHGDRVRCRVLSTECGRTEVSLRPSRLDDDLNVEEAVAEDPFPEEGAVVKGYVASTTGKGCFVRLSRSVTARVLIKDLSDDFVKNPTEAFPPGKLVAGRVLSVDLSGRKVDLSLRASVVVGEYMHKIVFDEIEEGAKHKGTVTRVESYGVFIKVKDSDVTGLCHISECADERIKDLSQMYQPGDAVKAFVLKVDREAKKINFSLKPSRFKGDLGESESEEGTDEEEGTAEEDEEDSDADDVMEVVHGGDGEGTDEGGDEEDEDEDEEPEDDGAVDGEGGDMEQEEEEEEEDESDDDNDDDGEKAGVRLNDKAAATLSGGAQGSADNEDDDEDDDGADSGDEDGRDLEAMDVDGQPGFQWDDLDLGVGSGSAQQHAEVDEESEVSDEDDSDDEEGGHRKSRSSRKKAAERRREEARVREREERLLDHDAEPETADDFERLLLATPNSSYLWIKYMAFQLSLADIDAARAVAERALKSINFREATEKMNVWVALMNLEHKYGTPETVSATLERAAQHSHPKHIHLQAAEMYERVKELDQAEAVYHVMIKKFKYSKKVWIAYHHFKLALQKDAAGATDLLRRSLQSLSKHKHTLVISKFAQLEFEHGSVDRGRTIFEGLISSYPKRLDIWNVYVDKEVKAGDIDAARRLLDRMCTLRLSAAKMKGVLKKYLKVELDHGNEETIEAVRQRAREYVEASMG